MGSFDVVALRASLFDAVTVEIGADEVVVPEATVERHCIGHSYQITECEGRYVFDLRLDHGHLMVNVSLNCQRERGHKARVLG